MMSKEQTWQEVPAASPSLCIEADFRSALELSRLIAVNTGMSCAQAFDTLNSSTPMNLQCMLTSPEGWVALGEFVASSYGGQVIPIAPTIH